jgi:hypothetical protein
MADGTVGRDGCLFPQKQYPFFFRIKMSAPEAEGGQDRDDILGFPGDGYQDPQDGDPLETMDEDLDSGAAGMTEESASSGPSSAKKRRKSAPVPLDEFVKQLERRHGSPGHCTWHCRGRQASEHR